MAQKTAAHILAIVATVFCAFFMQSCVHRYDFYLDANKDTISQNLVDGATTAEDLSFLASVPDITTVANAAAYTGTQYKITDESGLQKLISLVNGLVNLYSLLLLGSYPIFLA